MALVANALQLAKQFLALLALLAALFFYGPSYNLSFLFYLAAALLALLVLAGPEALAAFTRSTPKTMAVALAALAALVVHHCFASVSFETSAMGAWLLAIGPLSLLVWSAWLRTPGVVPWVPYAVPLLAVACIVGVSFVRLLWEGERPYDPLPDPSALACLLYLFWIPWVQGRYVCPGAQRPRPAWLVLSLSLVLLTVLFATGSRAALGLIMLAFGYWALLSLRDRPLRLRIGLLGMTAMLAYGLAFQSSAALRTSVNESLLEDAATDQRLTLFKVALEAYEIDGFHGSGAHTFGLRYGALRPLSEQTSGGEYVHNDYLQLLVEGGPWLLLPLLLLAATAVLQLLLALVAPDSRFRYGDAGGWLALALASLHATVNFIIYTPALALSLGALLAWTLRAETGGGAMTLPKLRLAWALLLLGGVGCLGVLFLDSMNGAVFSGQAPILGSDRSSAVQQQRFAAASLALLPQRGLPRLVLALAAEQRARQAAERGATAALVAELNLALDHYRQSQQVDPWNTQGAIHYARFLAFRESPELQRLLPPVPWSGGLQPLEDGERPQALLEAALARNPRSLDLLGALVGLLDHAGQRQAADARIQQHFLDWLPNHRARKPALARDWLAEALRRAQARGDDQGADTLALELARTEALVEKMPPPRFWFQRWQQRHVKPAAGRQP